MSANTTHCTVVLTLFSGACDLWRVRGFVALPSGRPNLEREVYAGKWKNRADAEAEIAWLAGERERV